MKKLQINHWHLMTWSNAGPVTISLPPPHCMVCYCKPRWNVWYSATIPHSCTHFSPAHWTLAVVIPRFSETLSRRRAVLCEVDSTKPIYRTNSLLSCARPCIQLTSLCRGSPGCETGLPDLSNLRGCSCIMTTARAPWMNTTPGLAVLATGEPLCA